MTGLEDLYREIILDHYRSPRNRGELPVPPAHRVEGFNPLCGDEVVVYLEVDDDKVTELRDHRPGLLDQPVVGVDDVGGGEGQVGAEARRLIRSFKSMMSIHEQRLDGDGAPSRRRDRRRRRPRRAGGPAGRGEIPVRIKCATLSWNTLAQGLDDFADGVTGEDD